MVDIESRLVAWLNASTGIEWHGDVPERRPDEFGTLERTGGGISDVVIDSPEVALQVWAPTRSRAKDLAIEVCRVLPRFAYEPGIRKAVVDSAYNFPDGKRARYQITAHFKTV